jgi:4'-phosphopantetheinyl transferase EntD
MVVGSAIVRSLLPPCVEVAEGPIGWVEGELWPEEAERVANAVAKRRGEYAAGRILARRAILALGGPDRPILAGEDRAPRWPSGFTGSISHSAGYVAAVAGRLSDVAAVGIDVEDVARFRPEIDRSFLSPEEIAQDLAGHAAEPRMIRAAALFSAKEAFYKCQYPLTGLRLGFRDVVAELDGEARTFLVRRRFGARSAAAGFEGRFMIRDGLVATAILLAPDLGDEARAVLMAPIQR